MYMRKIISSDYKSSNTGPNLLQIVKLPSQHLIMGHNRQTSETPFKWRFAGGPITAHYCGIWIIPPPPSNLKKKKKKTLSKLDWTPQTKLSGFAHGSIIVHINKTYIKETVKF